MTRSNVTVLKPRSTRAIKISDLAERLDTVGAEVGVLFHALFGLAELTQDDALDGMTDLATRIQHEIEAIAEEVRS